MHPTRVELLQRMPVFGGIREDVLDFLLEFTETVAVPAGGYFFREHDQASSMFVLESGAVQVVKSWQGIEYVLHGLGPGDCFGEMALMDLLARSASIRATEDCIAMELAASDLLRLFERDAEQFALVQMNIGREVCRRLRATDERLFRAIVGAVPPALDTLFRAT
jgi:CRP/FNR family transcriptional regulator, cyclic AMP receptor protein